MRHITLLASTAGLVLAISAAVGVTSAAAVGSELCTVSKQNPCFHVNMVMEGTTITTKLKGGPLLIKQGLFGDIQCSESTTSMKTTNTGGTTEHVFLGLEGWTFATCTFGGNECTVVKSVNVGAGMQAVNGEYVAGTGKITLGRNKAGEEWGLEAVCPGMKCILKTGKMELDLINGSPAGILAEEQFFGSLTGNKTECPTVAPGLNAENEVTSPKSLYGVIR